MVQVLIPLAGVVDVVALRWRKVSKVEAEAKSLKGRLGNPNVDKAPEVVKEPETP